MVELDIWERKKNLENVKEVIAEFEGRINAEVRRQEKLDLVEEQDFRRGELPEKYAARCCINEMMGSLRKNT